MPALKESHAAGSTQPALLEETIGENFARAVAAHADRAALVSRHQIALHLRRARCGG